MNDLKIYLDLPATHQLYSAGLALLDKYGGNAHATAISKLSPGPFGNNRFQLLQLLSKLYESPPGYTPTEVVVHQPVSKTIELTPSTNEEINLLIALRKARQYRAQCSQQFHACSTDEERAGVCDLIDKATANIKQLKQDYEYLKSTGQLPAPKDEYSAPLPDTEEELAKEQTRLSSQRLKVENRIIHLLGLKENSSKRKKIPELEDKLRLINARWAAVRFKRKKLEHESKEND
jgi:chaperonin cofactor prefoldin